MLLASQTLTTFDLPEVKMKVGFTDRASRLWCQILADSNPDSQVLDFVSFDLGRFPTLRHLIIETAVVWSLIDLRVLIQFRPLLMALRF